MGLARREVKERVCECNPLLLVVVVVVVVVTAAAMMVGGGGEGKWVKSLGRELASLALPPPVDRARESVNANYLQSVIEYCTATASWLCLGQVAQCQPTRLCDPAHRGRMHERVTSLSPARPIRRGS